MDCTNNELKDLLLDLKSETNLKKENDDLKRQAIFLQKELAEYNRQLSTYKVKYFHAKYRTDEEKKDYAMKKRLSKKQSIDTPERLPTTPNASLKKKRERDE